MRKLLFNLLAFAIVFEFLGAVRLGVLITALGTTLAVIAAILLFLEPPGDQSNT